MVAAVCTVTGGVSTLYIHTNNTARGKVMWHEPHLTSPRLASPHTPRLASPHLTSPRLYHAMPISQPHLEGDRLGSSE